MNKTLLVSQAVKISFLYITYESYDRSMELTQITFPLLLPPCALAGGNSGHSIEAVFIHTVVKHHQLWQQTHATVTE